ncbi:U4/U6.U5 tri-snRNP-associated protein [Thraustotheca clavata]|uniref:U4/U6.U5 tri-snRNP-associated protein n=1 Tax=Thraustotheca clavata TaxID=74557 RepID=A0A1W0AC97_9STRA|nr:U4/U6.U5 tri-snRNP-associated protein [Thraustotheca clavata]
MKRKQVDDESGANKRKRCPYLDTIKPQLLDFDFEKVCSVTLSPQNAYACLVCGKYFQGRGPNTHAYTHALQSFHHVFINLQTDKIYCLPDNYEVFDLSLLPIKNALRPTYTKEDIAQLDKNRKLAQDSFGVSYLPGFVGLNNLKKTDYISVVLVALAHVPPLRDFFLEPENYMPQVAKTKSNLVVRFGEMMRKMWSPHNIKNTISPHEIVQEITVASKKRFQIGRQQDCLEFLSWFLNELHRGVGGTKHAGSSIIHRVFQGMVQVKTLSESAPATTTTTPFLFLSLDLPPTPLFKDSQGGNVIPQVPLFTVLEKFDGEKITHVFQGAIRQQKRYILQTLPQYLIFHIHRFTKNNFFTEKNPTIVNFPVKNLELADHVGLSTKNVDEMSITELKTLLKSLNGKSKGIVERDDLVKAVKALMPSTKYNLVANICHDSPPTIGQATTAVNMDPLADGSYRVHVQNRATEQWYELQDLHVQETMPQLIGISESYVLVYERQASNV